MLTWCQSWLSATLVVPSWTFQVDILGPVANLHQSEECLHVTKFQKGTPEGMWELEPYLKGYLGWIRTVRLKKLFFN